MEFSGSESIVLSGLNTGFLSFSLLSITLTVSTAISLGVNHVAFGLSMVVTWVGGIPLLVLGLMSVVITPTPDGLDVHRKFAGWSWKSEHVPRDRVIDVRLTFAKKSSGTGSNRKVRYVPDAYIQTTSDEVSLVDSDYSATWRAAVATSRVLNVPVVDTTLIEKKTYPPEMEPFAFGNSRYSSFDGQQPFRIEDRGHEQILMIPMQMSPKDKFLAVSTVIAMAIIPAVTWDSMRGDPVATTIVTGMEILLLLLLTTTFFSLFIKKEVVLSRTQISVSTIYFGVLRRTVAIPTEEIYDVVLKKSIYQEIGGNINIKFRRNDLVIRTLDREILIGSFQRDVALELWKYICGRSST